MDTNKHEFEQFTEYTEQTESLADVGHRSEEFAGRRKILSEEELGGLRLLGGSSRFAQVEITSCGSLKSIDLWPDGAYGLWPKVLVF